MKVFLTDSWNKYLEYFNDCQKDIYYSEEYVKLYQDEKHLALCAVAEDGTKYLLLPFLRADVEGCYDFETAYGYGGPITNSSDTTYIKHAISQIEQLLKEERYVCGFVRFNALLNNQELIKDQFDVFYDRDTVAIDTEVSVNEIWANQISSKNRNMIRKAEKSGLVYKAEYDFKSIDEFIGLYEDTMRRLNAEDFYYFDRIYYQNFISNLEENAFLGTVRKDGILICSALFMYSKDYGHYHLEGSDRGYSSLGANNYLLWKTAVEFNKLGVKKFHLGGGYNTDSENSLLKFKKSFSKNCLGFYIGKWIFDTEKYEDLKFRWEKQNPSKIKDYSKYLLCYRY